MSTIFGPTADPPRGWTVFNGVLTLDATLAGYLARRREVTGVCQQRDCRRRCDLDVCRYVERGLGRLTMRELQRLYRCNRLGGCAMEFQEHHGSVLTLGMLRGRPGVAVRFACGKCRKEVIVPPAAAIAKLSTEGGRGEDTPIDELGGLAKAACTCGAMSWKVEILWHDPNKVPEWVRRALDRREGAPAGK